MKQLILVVLLVCGAAGAQDRTIRVPLQPQVSPDGNSVAFTWQNDIWVAPVAGGVARRVTTHTANDSSPHWSPDGSSLAFLSDRGAASQVYVVAAAGGMPRQITIDSSRKSLLGYTADGNHLLVGQTTDRGWHRSESGRLFEVHVSGKRAKRMLFDCGYAEAALSPDGGKVLFTRGRASFSRKGYRGAQASQMWLADLNAETFEPRRLDKDRPNFQNVSWKAPLWTPDGAGFYYVSDPDGTFDVYHHDLATNRSRRVTNVSQKDRSDDGVAYPSLSSDGKTMVFRRRFDLFKLDVPSGRITPIAMTASGDAMASANERRAESNASSVAFTNDGKQMAFVAGDDVWVMDRVLKEPVRVTYTPHRESSLVFSADGKQLFFTSDVAGEMDIWEATCKHEKGFWWQSDGFDLRQITDDAAPESDLTLSPTGKHVAYIKGTDVFVMDADGSDHRRVIQAWSRPDFDWSPDGKWFVYATQDDDYNSDVWIVPLDGTRDPFNLSRHPDRDGSPRWSPSGDRIAFVGRRDGEESDIYWVNLVKKSEEETDRDRKLKEALAAMEKGARPSRGGGGRPAGARAGGARGGFAGGGGGRRRGGFGRRGRGGRGQPATPPAGAGEPNEAPSDERRPRDRDTEPVVVKIDFDGIFERMHRIRVEGSERGLLWSPRGDKLAFNGSIDGERGFYTVSFPDPGTPTRMATSSLMGARWLKDSDEIVGMSAGGGFGRGAGTPRGPRGPRRRGGFRGFGGGGGVPAAMSSRGTTTTFTFSVRRERDWRKLRQVAFDQGWRAMRDRFYDENMNNRDWNAIREKYRDVAARCLGATEFSEVMNMMLGELNASHMGHRGGSDPLPTFRSESSWTPTTYHLGVRFDPRHDGDGLLVESVIPGSPCSEERSLVKAGEVVTALDGLALGPGSDVERLLTMDQVRDVALTVVNSEGVEREVTVRPTASVARLLYPEWVENTRREVERLSEGKLGYLHIQGMNMTSFRKMEEDLYHAGHGKEGLIIDVRFNGGGSTTDHVLTALTQPRHAITVSRGSGEGYPQDRKVYASWHKPIVLMCNEHSFSNAEILSHAVKQIGRGRLVGMRTAGGVISTGSARLLDGSTVRMPTRGWYLVTTGEDMELNGCEPDICFWNPPGGGDEQLGVAVKALLEDVAAEKAKPKVKPTPAAQKRRKPAPAGPGGGD